jgi:uncharacterized protein
VIPADVATFEERLYAYVGRQVCPPTPGKDPVNVAMIRHWTQAMGDENPAYTDSDWAASSRRGRTVMPPAMLYCWHQEGFPVAVRGRTADAQSELVGFFDANGYFGTLGTNVKQEYLKEVSPGAEIFMEMTIDSISERKSTSRGVGYFFETLATFTDSRGGKIGTQRFRVLKFIPPIASAAEQS